jgi:hypothetical protein
VGFSLTGAFYQFTAFYFAGRKIVFVAPDPEFSGLNGTDQRMAAVMEVLRGVLVFGIITAAYMTAFEAESQMYPGVASRNALFANVDVGIGKPDLIQMGTGGHLRLLQLSSVLSFVKG